MLTKFGWSLRGVRHFALCSALLCVGVGAATGQTVFSGSYSESGTRTDCSSGNPTNWTETGTFTVTLTPAFSSLGTNGGSVSGTLTYSGTNVGCTTQMVSGQGTAAGSVGAGGQVTLTLSETVSGCSFTAQGTVGEISGSIPQACLTEPGSGSFDLTSRSSPTGSAASATCVPFPSGLIPFTSIDYVTAADSAGDHLVVGVPSPGLLDALANLPLPAFTNQMFCDTQVQLAPGQYYPSVYVPTADESGGNFNAFAGLLVNPANQQPYSNGVIPPSQLGTVFAMRIGAAQAAGGSPNWQSAGSLLGEGSGGLVAMALLPNGKVLLVGWVFGTSIYDPASGSFTATPPPLYQHGNVATATLMSNGKVLVVGGAQTPAAAELYDPSTNQFINTGQPLYPHGNGATATLLNDGRVLVVGGIAAPGLSSPSVPAATFNAPAEIYDPQSGTFSAAGAMVANRNSHAATLLADGRVLITGGQATWGGYPTDSDFDSAEIFDPSSGTFSFAGTMTEPRIQHYAVLLPNGKVLIGGAGGLDMGSAELFDPTSRLFTLTGPMTSQSRFSAIAALLPSGQVLVTGGKNSLQIATNTAELYDPGSGTFSATGNMTVGRDDFSGVLLQDGRFFVYGGATSVCCSQGLNSAEIYTPTVEGLVTSQSGLTFQFAQGNPTAQSQSVAVLSTTTAIPWNASTSTYEGGNWLSISTSSGNSVPGAAPITLTITANPAGLSAQTYYGSVTLTPTDGVHPPVTIAIVLNIVPAGTSAPPQVSPSGIVLTGSPGSTLAPQTFTISNLTSSPISFTAAGSNAPLFFSVTPTSASIPAAQSATVKITPNITGLTAGAYKGTVTLTFGGGSTQIVQLLLVLSTGASSASSSVHRLAASTCTPTKLLPIFTSIGSGFSVLAAWPIPINVEVVDDCTNAINSGSVIVSFSDGDPPIGLISTGNGNWAGTWVPQNNEAGFSARADAQQSQLAGTVSISGGTSSNAAVPVVFTGGVVSSGDFASPPAQGLLVSIFGSGLADSSVGGTLPLGNQIGSTQVLLGNELLPLLYASDALINVLIPYDVALNTTEQLVVQHASAISVPVKTAVFSAAPSILSTNGSGSGQGHIYVIGAQGQETLADQNAPATAGNNLVIYCIGLGAVNPAVVGGSIALSSPLSQATLPVTVTFGGVTATAAFAGLTPGEAGLYQINVTIPPGVPTSTQVPVTISAGAASSSSSIYMAIQ